MIRVRHYTRISSMRKIMSEGRIMARDRNSVFVERANRKPRTPRDVEAAYLITLGKGNAYVEFDSEDAELHRQLNPRTGKTEYFLEGDVDLSSRNAAGFENR